MNTRKTEMNDLNIKRQLFLTILLQDSEFLNTYKQLKTDKERFSHALAAVVGDTVFLLDSNCVKKNAEDSIKFRRAANENFVSRQYYDAVQEYTKSIVYAIDSSEELALSYANRSAALFELKKHADCITDIDRALSLKYPDRLKTKLYKRKGSCLTALGMPGADSAFQEALIWLEKTTLRKVEIDQMKSKLKELISVSYEVAKPPENITQYSLPDIISPNLELPCASDAVALKYSEEFGRHLVATRKIKPGEVIAIEKPYCMRVCFKNIYTHCSYCLQVSWSMIPCKHCVNAAYCSEACKAKAWEEYHEIECPAVELLRDFEINEMLWMSMRLAIMATRKGMKFDDLKQELMNIDRHKDQRTKGFCNDGKFHSDKYSSVYTLAHNIDMDCLQMGLIGALWTAITTCALAQSTEIFGEKPKLDSLAENPNVMFLGELMLKHNRIIFLNMHSFGASRSSQSSAHGHALMAACSLLNHACDPNVVRQWYSDCMVIYASYPIEEGEQIFDNYGPHYVLKDKSRRQFGLTHWNFNCICLPCKENWPLLEDLPSYKEQPLTRANKNKIDTVLEEFVVMNRHLLNQGLKENAPILLNGLLKTIEILFKLVHKPCGELASAVAMLEDLYATAEAVFDYKPRDRPVSEEQYLLSYSYFEDTLLRN